MRDNGPFAKGRALCTRHAVPAMSESSPGVSPPSTVPAASPPRVAHATRGTMALTMGWIALAGARSARR